MKREEIIEICDREILDTASRLFGTKKERLNVFPDYEGCANLVYEYECDGTPLILRISFRPDRNTEQIQSELHFIHYLAENGVRVSKPIFSQNGNLLEVVRTSGIPFHVVSFVKGKGMGGVRVALYNRIKTEQPPYQVVQALFPLFLGHSHDRVWIFCEALHPSKEQ